MSERLVFLHGFTQTHHHWHRCAHLIGAALGGPDLAFVDLPGHGLSSADRTTIEETASLLGALAGAGTYVGYSMGGRTALVAAAAGLPEIQRLVLVGATPGLADADERSARVADDERRAARVELIGAPGFVDEWLAQPLFDGAQFDARDRRHRLRNTADGLASSLRLSGTGAQTSVWDQLGRIAVPVLVLAGERDTKFVAVAERLASAIPGAACRVIPGAGHAAHTERPDATAELVADWLRTTL